MPPVILAISLVVVAATTAMAVVKALTGPDGEPIAQPVREDPPVRVLKRDPITGEYRPG